MASDNYLKNIHSPADIKGMSYAQLNELAAEIRTVLIDTVSKNGGHLASNLGVVELTLAMHKEFDSPRDKFVWDVGHQAYTHKLLTGRYERFHTLRQEGGLSGFCRPDESEHDMFYSGHSSTPPPPPHRVRSDSRPRTPCAAARIPSSPSSETAQ